jgi:DNA mismatch repair protein MutL
LTIQFLPSEIVDTITAGEVIDSFAAVVRELSENAIDAGATRISIAIFGDRWRVLVSDNGSGIALADLQLAAAAHSTSKIHDRDDLFKISSLGFRGEALHSLAQLANLEIYSRTDADDCGHRVSYNRSGEVTRIQAVAIALGTIVDVSNLFANWQARRAGLPPFDRQLRQVQRTIYHLALCYPHVTWQIERDDLSWFQIIGRSTAREILAQILPKVSPTDLQYVEVPIVGAQVNCPAKIELTLGLPDRAHRHRADWILVAVNGRVVKAPELEPTIFTELARTLPRDRYPICFLHLHIDPIYIDWNRHPAKSEIYLQQIDRWQTGIGQAIDRALQINPTEMTETAQTIRVGKLLTAAEERGAYTFDRRQISASEEPTGFSWLELTAVGQVLNTYIVAEYPDGLWLVEQHIAHERVLYEQISSAWQLLPLEQPLLIPHLSTAQIEQLERIGMEIDPFGNDLWAIRTAPAPLLLRDDLAAATIELSQGGDLQAAQVATACRCAIRNGTPLNLTEMQNLLDRWKRTRNPRTCPHGRPIYLAFAESALAKSFRRHWVIGKSHGI